MEKHERDWYVEQHRQKWRRIFSKIVSDKEVCDIRQVERDYMLFNYGPESQNWPAGACFACEYMMGKKCDHECLFNWSKDSEFKCCSEGLYREILGANTWQDQARLARRIANLPIYKKE